MLPASTSAQRSTGSLSRQARNTEGQDVRRFGAFTGELCALADWLKQCGIQTVAMESTGVYWIALYELLMERGFEVRLVDARQAKNVPGRKSDVLDCQWLQELHTYGLLRGCVSPCRSSLHPASYLRQRSMLVSYASHHIQHMQKALEQMNLKLAHVVSDITGLTGMGIIKAILSGERDPVKFTILFPVPTLQKYRGHWEIRGWEIIGR